MNKKNVFSYFMWIIYSLVVGTSLFGITGTLSRQTGFTVELGYGVGALWLVLSGIIVFLIYKLLGKGVSDIAFEGKVWLLAEIIIAVILVGVGITLRVTNLASAGEDASYFAITVVAEGQSIPVVVHGASYLYLQLLHLIFLLFGNSFMAGVWLQIILCVLATAVVYFAVRKIAGIVAAMIMLDFLMIGPLMIEESLMLSPEMLFLLIYAIGLLAVAFCIRGSKKVIICLLVGIVIGLCTYPDIYGVSLLFMAVTGILLRKNDEDITVAKRIVSALICILGAFVGFGGVLFVDALLCGKSFLDVLNAWWQLYLPETFVLPGLVNLVYSSLDVLFLILLLAIGIFSFWCSREIDRQSVWIIPIVILVLFQCFGMGVAVQNVMIYLYLLMAIIAGTNITLIFKSKESEPKEAEAVEKRSRKTVRTPVLKEEEPQIQYLENPLPLPKKHERKTLDFDIVDIEVEDDFDYNVADDDDYDI